jgi:ComF family protein
MEMLSFVGRNLARFSRRSCVVCSLAAGEPLCADCEADFFSANRPRCTVCAVPLHGADARCGHCLAEPRHFHRTTALGDYAPPVDGLVLALKFGARLELAEAFGRLLAQRVLPDPETVVVPVPLSFERLSERGFNQSLQIARAYCSTTGARLASESVRRIRNAPPQQSLSLAQRRRNIRGAFDVIGTMRGKRALVIDDVLTTGSTLNEVARVLSAAGAVEVHALVVARTP